MRQYIEHHYGLEASNRCFADMDQLIIYSLKAVQPVMINDRHCFECYGYDVLIDDTLKPWLVEVNASPSLSTTTENDRVGKTSLLRDIYNVVCPNVGASIPSGGSNVDEPPNFRENRTSGDGPVNTNLAVGVSEAIKQPCQPSGAFYVLYDEAHEERQKEEDEKIQLNRRKGTGAPTRHFSTIGLNP